MDEKTMNKLSYGLFVLTARLDGKDNGCIINTASQVTSSPLRISITVNKSNLTHDMIAKSRAFNLSVLSEKADFDIFTRFGFASGRDTDKMANGGYLRTANGIAYLKDGVNAYISARVENQIDLDTHTMFIAEVTACEIIDEAPSATYAFYHSNIKPKPKATADSTKIVWRCSICGFEVTADSLEPDFICPICTHPASDFERV